MRNSNFKDYLYVIFMGFLLFLSGSIILGGIKYFLELYVGFDFISVILYYLIAVYLTRQVIKNVYIRNLFVSIYLPVLTGLMYIFSDYVSFIIIYAVQGVPILTMLKIIPEVMLYTLISYFTSFSASVDGIFIPIINILFLFIEILILIVGIVQSYKVTRRE